MKKITSLFALLFLWIGAQCAWAQSAGFRVSSAAGTQYEYYIAVMNSTDRVYVHTNPSSGADSNCFGISTNPTTETGLAKFTISEGTAGCYIIKSVDRNANLYYTTTVDHAANSVRTLADGDTENTANTEWIVRAKSASFATGFSIGPKEGNAVINWNKHGSTLGLWGNQSAASVCVFVPANLEAMNAMYEDMTAYVDAGFGALDAIGGIPSAGNTSVTAALASIKATMSTALSVPDGGFTEYSFAAAGNLPFYTPSTDEFNTAIGTTNHLYLPTGYYYFKSQNTDNRPPHLYNDYFKEANTQHHTLQANERGVTNNYIWHITNNGNGTIAIVNGEGTPVVKGVQNAGADGAITTHSTLTFNDFNLSYFQSMGGVHFTENLNASNGFKLSDNTYYLTTWNAGPGHADNRWTFEPVAVDGKNVYTVSISGLASSSTEVPYVTCGDEKAFAGGFFIKESVVAASDVTASAVSNYTNEVTVSGNNIQVVYTPQWNSILQETIASAETALANAPAETGIGYPTAEAKTALQDQIAASKVIEVASESDVTALQEAMQDFNENVLLPTDGSYVRIKNYNRDLGRDDYNPNSPTSHDGEGGYMSATNRRSSTAVGVQNTTLDDAGAIWKLEATGETGVYKLYNLNIKKYLGKTNANSNSQYVSVTDNEEEAGTYVLATTKAYPQFTISCANVSGGAYKQLHASGYGLMNWGTGLNANGSSAWIISEATEFDVTLNKAKEDDTESYASVYLPFNVTLPASGVTANKGVANADNTEFTLTSVGSGVPAENGVILVNSEAAASVTLGITQTEVTADMDGNDLTGTLVKKDIDTNASYYFLGVNDALIAGMYRPAAALTQIPANKAYLEEVGGSVQGYRFSFGGETTGIGSVGTTDSANGVYYDLSGRRVQNPQKGVYILGNRKVVLK